MKITKKEVDNLVNILFRLRTEPNRTKDIEKVTNTILPFMDFVDKDNWQECSFCSDFYEITDGKIKLDIREMAYCCVPMPTKNCPFRFLVLRRLGLTENDYQKLKEKIGEDIKKKYGVNNGK